MNRNIFFISDTHFHHEKMLTFKKDDGNLYRPEFSNVDDMNEYMIKKWNDRVRENDIIYHLGDVCFGTEEEFDQVFFRLNGRKRLIVGNHDNFEMSVYRKHFSKIMSWRSFDKDVTGCDKSFVACHYPLHKSAYDRSNDKNKFCVHGHLHTEIVPEEGFISVCVEQTGYSPVSMEEILSPR